MGADTQDRGFGYALRRRDDVDIVCTTVGAGVVWGWFAEKWGSICVSIVSVYGGIRGAVLSVYCQYLGVSSWKFWRILR